MQCPRVGVCTSLTQEVRVTSHLDSIHVLPAAVHLQQHHLHHHLQHHDHQHHHHHYQQYPTQYSPSSCSVINSATMTTIIITHLDVNHMTTSSNNMWLVVTGVKRRNVFFENCCLNWGALQIARGRIVPGLHRRFSPFWRAAAVAMVGKLVVMMVIHANSLTTST